MLNFVLLASNSPSKGVSLSLPYPSTSSDTLILSMLSVIVLREAPCVAPKSALKPRERVLIHS